MEAKVIRRGDDLAVRVPAEDAEQLGLSEGQTIKVKRTPERRQRVLAAEAMFAEIAFLLGPHDN